MMGYIQGKAPKEKGNWDIAAIPGGGGNWGGSFLTVPKQGKHIQEAVDLVKWLTQPAQELTVFKNVGNLPSEPALYTDPALTSFTNPFFNNAPVGQIFANTAKNLTPQYLGKKGGPVRTAVENDLKLVEKSQLSPDKGWAAAVKDATKAAAS
jgi:cellobiose transport system substrate-binding protein